MILPVRQKSLSTTDSIFENEREKETFYMECMVQHLSCNNKGDSMMKQRMDEIKKYRVTRDIS